VLLKRQQLFATRTKERREGAGQRFREDRGIHVSIPILVLVATANFGKGEKRFSFMTGRSG
jgi:hypothetical protein